ncbi:hypothetical protein [Streptomyces sp. DH37]|uniref:hypothetical protein n=1 Tax=Streptomyces sp. DH37 TaxID=3040122 RepID=UPI0024418915|nr:hypothetical protein [Streptomyces sp. DH37]MDG9701588.1 hypothetical protein [Streptomyces sp. DH37]
MNDATAWRLNSTDEMLHQAATALGSSRVVQILWRLPVPVPAQALQAEWRRLDSGLLSRRAARAHLPGARRRWVPAANTHPLHLDHRPLTDATAPQWIDTQVRVPLAPDSTELWRLAAAPYHEGCLVSLTVPHFRSDGLGLLNAIAARAPARRPRGPRDSDAAEALGQTTRAVARTAGWLLRLARDPRQCERISAALRRPPAAAGPPARPQFFSTAIFTVEAAEWQECARGRGGTANTLFLQIAANLVRARVPRADREGIRVGIPVSLRRQAGDERANALVVVPLGMPGGPVRHGDLSGARQATKALLRDVGAHSATLVPEPLWHLLPARHAAALKNPGAQQTDVVASNFGHAPDAVVDFAGHTADSVAMRTMNVPGLFPDKARLRASLCLFRTGHRMTVTVTGMPAHFGDSASLHRLVAEEFAAWGLTARPWWSTTAHEARKG